MAPVLVNCHLKVVMVSAIMSSDMQSGQAGDASPNNLGKRESKIIKCDFHI